MVLSYALFAWTSDGNGINTSAVGLCFSEGVWILRDEAKGMAPMHGMLWLCGQFRDGTATQ